LAAARDTEAMMEEVSPVSDEWAISDFDPSFYIAIYPDIDSDPDAARAHYLAAR
jgi:hypothetical protein